MLVLIGFISFIYLNSKLFYLALRDILLALSLQSVPSQLPYSIVILMKKAMFCSFVVYCSISFYISISYFYPFSLPSFTSSFYLLFLPLLSAFLYLIFLPLLSNSSHSGGARLVAGDPPSPTAIRAGLAAIVAK